MLSRQHLVTASLWIMIFICGYFLSGCSVVMAAKQPNYKNMSVLEPGNDRAYVIAEFGTPQFLEEKDGKKTDIFVFTQGYSTGHKVGRAVFHIVADFFTLFLWEVVGTPAEIIADGREVKVQVFYDANEKIEKAEHLNQKGK